MDNESQQKDQKAKDMFPGLSEAESKDALHTVISALIDVQNRELAHRKARTWLIIASIILTTLLYYGTGYLFFNDDNTSGDYVARINFSGTIGEGADIYETKFIPKIKEAFEDEDAKGLILIFNSGGGSPVQSANIRSYIKRQMAKRPDFKVVGLASDIMASGAYLIGSGIPKLYADESSIVGSIGVRLGGMALDVTKKLSDFGIERRVRTAGANKNSFDPFLPERPEDKEKAKKLLSALHLDFIASVKAGRGDRLNAPDEVLFDGSFWTGKEAVKLGLIDGIKDFDEIMEEMGAEKYVDYTPYPDFFASMKRSFKTSMADALLETVRRLDQQARFQVD